MAEARPPHLLHFRISHYNEKVRWALDHKKWAHTRETIFPGFHIPRVRGLTGQNKTPVLILEGKPWIGSATILDEIERRRPEQPLFPEDPADHRRADEIQSYFDTEVAPSLRRLFWSTYLARPAYCARMATMGGSGLRRGFFRAAFPIFRPLFRRNMGIDRERLATSRERLSSYVDRLESELGDSGYIIGDRFTIADLSVSAVMTAILRPPEFPYPLPEPWPPELVELRAGIANRTGCKWVADIYRRHRDASAEIAPLARG